MSTLQTNQLQTLDGQNQVAVAGLGKVEDTGKNICTAWVNFNGTTTPPTIRDSYNVSSVVRESAGVYQVNFAVNMDNANYSVNVSSRNQISNTNSHHNVHTLTVDKFMIWKYENGTRVDTDLVMVQVFGGKA